MSVKKKTVTLKDWINGIGVVEVAKLLGVQEATVRHWRRGANLPSDQLKQKIKKFSRGTVTYDEMIDRYFKNQK